MTQTDTEWQLRKIDLSSALTAMGYEVESDGLGGASAAALSSGVDGAAYTSFEGNTMNTRVPVAQEWVDNQERRYKVGREKREGKEACGRSLIIVMACAVTTAALLGVGVYGVEIFAESGFVKFRMPAIAPGLEAVSGYTTKQYWGVFIACVALPLSIVPALIGIGESFAARALSSSLRLVLLLGWATAYAYLSYLAYDSWGGKNLLNCGVVGCPFGFAEGSNASQLIEDVSDYFSGFFPVLGLVSFLVCVTFALVSALLALALAPAAVFELLVSLTSLSSSSDTNLTEPLLNIESSSSARVMAGSSDNLHLVKRRASKLSKKLVLSKILAASAGIFLPVAFVAITSLYPSNWLTITAYKVAHSASMQVSTEARHCRLAAISEAAAPVFPLQKYSCPEVPWALMKTINVTLVEGINGHWEHHPFPGHWESGRHSVVAKIYIDVVLFYVLIYAIVLLGILGSLSERARDILHSHAPIRVGGKVYHTPSIGQALIFLVGCVTLSLFAYHWYHDHNWHSWYPVTLPFIKEPTKAEKVARTSGQVANFVMGLLMLPASRSSLFVTLLDVPWEVLLASHIYLGYAFLFTVAIHMVSWWFVYGEQEIFPHDVLSVHQFFPLNFHAKPGECSTLTCLDPEYQLPAGDNWTIPLASMFMLFVGFPVFGLLTLNVVRRYNFELFYYSHHVFLVLFAVVLWHASSSWYFVSMGIFLWIVDRLLRFASGMRHVQIDLVKAHSLAKVTQIDFSIAGNADSFQAGHYVFLNVPAISSLQWHPFSIAGLDFNSSSNALKASLRIKSCGDFTQQLLSLAQMDNLSDVRVDGPYGAPLLHECRRFETVVMVAGGIGCTPLFALLDEFVLANLSHPVQQNIAFVWIVRSPHLAGAFTDQLERIQKFLPGVLIHIFVTGAKEDTLESQSVPQLPVPTRTGRPSDLPAHIRSILSNGFAKPVQPTQSTMLCACGPHPLVNDARQAARTDGYEFRTETFEL